MELFCNALFASFIAGAVEFAPGVMQIDHYDPDTEKVTQMYVTRDDYDYCLDSTTYRTSL